MAYVFYIETFQFCKYFVEFFKYMQTGKIAG